METTTVPHAFVLARVPRLATNFLEVLEEARARYGDTVTLRLPNRAIWAFHPESVHEILSEQAQSFRKSENYRALSPLLGDSVITTDGETWRRQRRVIAPEFHESRVREFVPLMDQITRERLEKLRASRELMLQGFLFDWGFEIASRAFFGQSQVAEPSKVSWLFNQGARGLFLTSVFRLRGRRAKLNPWGGELARSLEVIDSWARELIQKRKSEQAASGCPFAQAQDVLGRIIAASGSESGVSDRELRDQAVSILMAGHDTTALSLFWALQLLIRSPEWMARARDEADRFFEERDELDYDSLGELSVIDQVIQEAIRLYPAVNTMSREALEDVRVGELELKKGQVVQLAPWVTHRHPSAWENPGTFDPGRFAPERKSTIPPGAYFPFSLGPRTCVAQAFAMTQMKILLARLLSEFSLGQVRTEMPGIRPFLTLRPSADSRIAISSRLGHA